MMVSFVPLFFLLLSTKHNLLTWKLGIVTSLKNVKKDVQEMRRGTECGMGFENWEDFQTGDMIQTFEERTQKRTLPL
jgi:translation initiation factor IF-2